MWDGPHTGAGLLEGGLEVNSRLFEPLTVQPRNHFLRTPVWRKMEDAGRSSRKSMTPRAEAAPGPRGARRLGRDRGDEGARAPRRGRTVLQAGPRSRCGQVGVS